MSKEKNLLEKKFNLFDGLNKKLHYSADRLFDFYNKNILDIDENTLNPEISLLTKEEFDSNKKAKKGYAILGAGFGLMWAACITGVFKESIDTIYSVSDIVRDSGAETYFDLYGATETAKHFGMFTSYLLFSEVSSFFTQRSLANVGNLRRKEKSKDYSS